MISKMQEFPPQQNKEQQLNRNEKVEVHDNNLEDTGKKKKKALKSNSKNLGEIKKINESQSHGQKQPKLTTFWKNNNSMGNSVSNVSKTNATILPPKQTDQKTKIQADLSKNKKMIERIMQEKETLKNKYITLQNETASYREKTQQILQATMRQVAKYKRQQKCEVIPRFGWYAFSSSRDTKQTNREFIEGKFLTEIKERHLLKQKQLAIAESGSSKISDSGIYVKVLKKEIKSLQEEVRKRMTIVQQYKDRLRLCEQQKSCKFEKDNWPLISNQYLPMELLGSGGFGEVYKCFDLKSNQFVALKINQVPTDSHIRQNQVELILKHIKREIEIQRKLNHPNITKVLGVLEISPKQVSFFIEYCKGPQLSKYLKKHTCIEQSEAKQIIKQILNALKYLFEQPNKIIHYDLKPSNIMFHQGIVKILDFGLCKQIAHDETKIDLTSQGIGTWWYLPPETFLGEETIKISSKVDIWAVGVIFFELLYGQKPFGNGVKRDKNFSHYILEAKRVDFPHTTPLKYKVSEECKKFIRQCLKYSQDQRLDPEEAWNHPYFRS